jgi:hypothetical protein
LAAGKSIKEFYKKMRSPTRFSIVVMVLLLVLSGCIQLSKPEPTPTIPIPPTSTQPIPTETPIPPMPTPTETSVPTATGTPAPIAPVLVTVNVDSINLRKGPSRLYESVGTYDKGAPMTAFGQAPGGEWLLVKTEDDFTGWVAAEFMQAEAKTSTLPVFRIDQGYLVTGKVVGPDDAPIPGVVFAIHQGTESLGRRVDAVTDNLGIYYAFLPPGSGGTWIADLVGVACTSPIVDPDCKYSGKFSSVSSDVELPETAPFVITYSP